MNKHHLSLLLLVTAAALILGACADQITNESYYSTHNHYYDAPPNGDDGDNNGGDGEDDAGADVPDDDNNGGDNNGGDNNGGGDNGGGEGQIPAFGAPFEMTDTAQSLTFDPFAQDGVVYWFELTQQEWEALNRQDGGFDPFGDPYRPNDGGGGGAAPGKSSNLSVYLPDGRAANLGKVETRLIGQSTWRPWTPESIPNIRVDTDEYQEGLKLGGEVEHFRLNNSQVGTIFSEAVALELYKQVGYPAPRPIYAFAGSNAWGNPETLVPFTMTSVYKKKLCKGDNADFFGGGCRNLWETVGKDLVPESILSFTDADCQHLPCDTTRLMEASQVVVNSFGSPDFKELTADYIDWPAFHKFQCMSWLLWVGDDFLHNQNNIVIAEGEDGKLRFLPYSVDISAGMAWGGTGYLDIPLYGPTTILANGCQNSPTCWEDTLSTCRGLIAFFLISQPTRTVDRIYQRLSETPAPWGEDGGDGMLRGNDAQAYERIRTFYETRMQTAVKQLRDYQNPNGFPGDGGDE